MLGRKKLNFLPKNINTLVFGENFNKIITRHCNRDVSFIPDNIETLVFGKYFNQQIYHQTFAIPNKVKNLIFGSKFSQQIFDFQYGFLVPSSVIELTIHYKTKIDYIPMTVRKINFIDDNGKIINTIINKTS